MIIVLEGPDGAGKTFLANAIRDMVPKEVFHYKHLTWSKEIDKEIIEYMLSALIECIHYHEEGKLVVLDRWWPSTIVYDAVYREEKDYTREFYAMDAMLCKRKGTYVLCLPKDKADYVAEITDLSKKRDEMYIDKYDAVYDAYEEIAVASKGSPHWLRYDRFTDDTETLANNLLEEFINESK